MACSSCSFLRLLAGEAFWDSATRTDWVERMVEVTTWRQTYELGLYLLVNLTWVTGSTISVVIALPPRVSRIWLVAKLVTVELVSCAAHRGGPGVALPEEEPVDSFNRSSMKLEAMAIS